jgi:hypothetical protein
VTSRHERSSDRGHPPTVPINMIRLKLSRLAEMVARLYTALVSQNRHKFAYLVKWRAILYVPFALSRRIRHRNGWGGVFLMSRELR